MTRMHVAVHPGEVLREFYLEPLGMSAIAFANHLGVPRARIERLCRMVVSMSVDTALRLARYFGTTPEYWMNLQTNYVMIGARAEVDVSAINPLAAA